MILTITLNPAIDKIYIIDNYKLAEVHRPSKTIASAGGKGLNVARVAKLMGEEVMASGFIGGANGQYIHEKVEELGIISNFMKIQGETRTCINVSDTVNQRSTEVLEHGPVISQKEAHEFLETYDGLMDSVDVVTISGSLPKGLPTDYYASLIGIAKKHHKKIFMDTSGSAFKEGIKALPNLMKPNMDEIKELYSGDVTTETGLKKAIDFFQELGIEVPIISLGKDGCIAGLGDGIYRFTIPPVQVINTVGSGDSFIAGCAVGLVRGFDPIDRIKMGIACGTTNTLYSQTGYVEPSVVDNYFKQVEVIKID